MGKWYSLIKESQAFGTSPFGGSFLSDKVKLSPWGFQGGDDRTGIFEPSSGGHHPNDYLSEEKENFLIEKELEELNKRKKNKRKKIMLKKKKAQIEEEVQIGNDTNIFINNYEYDKDDLCYEGRQACDDFDLLTPSQLSSLIKNLARELKKQGESSSSHNLINILSFAPIVGLVIKQCPDAEVACDMKIKCKKNYEDYVIRAKKKIDEVLNFLGINLQQALNGEFESVQVKKDIGRPFKSEFQRTNIPYPRGLSKEWYNQIRDLERKENYANKKNKTLTAQWGTKGPKMPTWNNTEIERKKSTPKKWNKKILNIPQSKEKENPIDTEVEISSLLDSCVTINSESIKNQEIGSGFFFGENSILTCYHVAFPNKDENSKITIRHKGKDYKATSSVKNQNLDIAVLHIIDDPNFKSSKYLNLGKSRNIVQGEKIFIIGTPLGFENVVGEGIVSSTPIDYTDSGISKKYILISTNINPGNSGGPVIKESDGTVIGIAAAVITAEKTENSGLNAAIPIDDINLAIQNNFVHPEA